MHLVFDHMMPTDPVERTCDLILDHEIDHESVISVREGLANHRHASTEIEGVPVGSVLDSYSGPRDPEARF